MGFEYNGTLTVGLLGEDVKVDAFSLALPDSPTHKDAVCQWCHTRTARWWHRLRSFALMLTRRSSALMQSGRLSNCSGARVGSPARLLWGCGAVSLCTCFKPHRRCDGHAVHQVITVMFVAGSNQRVLYQQSLREPQPPIPDVSVRRTNAGLPLFALAARPSTSGTYDSPLHGDHSGDVSPNDPPVLNRVLTQVRGSSCR
jgi:hypothetical protein